MAIRRLYTDFIAGTITDDPLTSGATTLNASILSSLPVVTASTGIVPLILDPEAAGNGPEIVYVTAHSDSATSATIQRGRDGTSGVQHEAGTVVQQALTALDMAAVKTTFILAWSSGKGEAEEGDETTAFIWKCPFDCRVISATGTAGVAPTGDSIDFEVEVNGGTMFSTKPTIAASSQEGTKQAPSGNFALTDTDTVKIWITQVGSTTPGENVALALEIEVP